MEQSQSKHGERSLEPLHPVTVRSGEEIVWTIAFAVGEREGITCSIALVNAVQAWGKILGAVAVGAVAVTARAGKGML